MTEQTTEPEVDQTEEQPEPAAETPDTTEEIGKKGNPEAAKWRTKLRETETERDQLREQITAMKRDAVVQLATGPGRLVDGEDVFRNIEIEDVLDDDGNVDPEKVETFVESVATDKPHLRQPAYGSDVGIGERDPGKGTSWSDVIRG